MSFEVAADAYGRFMGRYSEQLADQFVDVADLQPGQRVLDVGCGPGALTARLVERLGVEHVAAVDPSAPFVEAVGRRFPDLEVAAASAEDLPFPDDSFDAAMAQLVVHFMSDPVAGLREMGRVTRAGGVVAACVWDMAGGVNPLALFWSAVRDLDPGAQDESHLPGVSKDHLVELVEQAGLAEVATTELVVSVHYETFDDWWQPYTLGVGPAGSHVAGLDEDARAALRSRCEEKLGPGPFDIRARAWSVRGLVS
ncbi:MAG TPA: class I SAM-dependent methyltransferase [Marmoricola sp.]|nr:class I SAM-dependent methyltransferase [Marmoricola sp.]